MSEPTQVPARTQAAGQVNWQNVLTVVSAAILIGVEVFGAALAGGWALAILFELGDYGAYLLQAIFTVLGVLAMVSFVRNASRVEPFVRRG